MPAESYEILRWVINFINRFLLWAFFSRILCLEMHWWMLILSVENLKWPRKCLMNFPLFLLNHLKEGNHIFNLIFKGSSVKIYIHINNIQPYPSNQEACVLSISITIHQHHYQHNHVHQLLSPQKHLQSAMCGSRGYLIWVAPIPNNSSVISSPTICVASPRKQPTSQMSRSSPSSLLD